MIKTGNDLEKEYRAIKMDSSSSLKEFTKDRKKYHKRYVLGEDIKDEESKAVTMGRLVETKLLEPELFDDRFIPSLCENIPTGLMLDFVNSLFDNYINNVKNNSESKFSELLEIAYKESGYKISFERVISTFNTTDARLYFEEKLKVYENNLTIVSLKDVANAENIVEQLRNNEFTKVVNIVSDKYHTVKNQYKVVGVNYKGLLLKGMFDKVIINHKLKTIQVYDLKCTWSVENFYNEYYIKNLSYIQSAIYHILATSEFKDLINEGYILNPIKYIVCDSIGYYDPLIYVLYENNLQDAINGFSHRGNYYPGVDEIVENIIFAKENDIWNISRENYYNNGTVILK